MDVIGLIGLLVAIVALGVPFTIEKLKKPSIEIVPSEWQSPTFVQWTFATVRVKNNPLGTPFKILLERQSAAGCKARIEYYEWDATAPFLRVPGRWSNTPEPLSLVPSSLTTRPSSTGSTPDYYPSSGPPTSGTPPYTPVHPPVSAGTAPTSLAGGITPAMPIFSSPSTSVTGRRDEWRVVYDPSRDPGQHDVTTEGDGEEIAVAILRDGKIFAFSTESYNYPSWGKPDWELNLRKIYRIIVHVDGPGISQTRAFKLDCLTANPSQFRLQTADMPTNP